MDIFGVLTLIGGLALFLYGMNVMGAGLEKMSGGKLEQLLEKLTSNPLKAVLLGAGVTAVIQSSSATTVMVVGFVNSGIMKLSQAIGIIMGANIGTTITAWLLSLTGIEGSSFFMQMLKPSSFAPILALVGIIFIMSGKSDKKKDLGSILLGFTVLMTGMDMMSGAVKPLADVPEFTNILTMFDNPVFGVKDLGSILLGFTVLMTGMDMMSGAVKPLADVPEFTNILTMFDNPVFGVIAGAVLTGIIQSSSASVGILQALSVTGVFTFSSVIPIIMGQNIGTCVTAGAVLTGIIQSSSASVGILQALSVTGVFTFSSVIPIIMGQNIGTCVTAMISAVGANKGARRTAFVHLYFNLIGTLLFLTVYFIGNAIIGFSFADQVVGEVEIALIHTIFNVFTTLVLLPFTKVLEKLAYLTIPLGEDEQHVKGDTFAVLDERFLNSPAFASSM